MAFSIVAAVDEVSGLGKEGDLAWRLKEDMAFFKTLTTSENPKAAVEKFGLDLKNIDVMEEQSEEVSESTQNAVIMGRKTWDSIPSAYAPLVGRNNIVLTRDGSLIQEQESSDVSYCLNLQTALQKTENAPFVYLIGGGSLYEQGIVHEQCHQLFLTKLKGTFGCDTFFPTIPDAFQLIKESSVRKEGNIEFSYTLWQRKH